MLAIEKEEYMLKRIILSFQYLIYNQDRSKVEELKPLVGILENFAQCSDRIQAVSSNSVAGVG